jgi:dihydrofolate synthase/folylpolyglutamate synthase
MHNRLYEETLDWLFQQFPSYQKIGSKAYKPTLENTENLLKEIGNPEKDLQFIHIAGSNGKGTTCSILASILKESGYRVGLFTSPHIKDFRERIRVNGEMISEQKVINFVEQIKSKKRDFAPSFFEVSFSMALDHFRSEQCDICIIETGLGGRLDATNVISPICSVITSISLEHTNILGDTHEAIAREKAGIIKDLKPVILGHMPLEALETIKQISRERHAPFFNAIDHAKLGLFDESTPEYMRYNTLVALKVIDLIALDGFKTTQDAIRAGMQKLADNTGYRARLDQIASSPDVFLDVSHNTEGINATLSVFKDQILHIVYGSSSDKNIAEIASVFPKNARLYLTTFNHERSSNLEDLKQAFKTSASEHISYFTDSQEAFIEAKKNAKDDETVLVMGSFFLLENFY